VREAAGLRVAVATTGRAVMATPQAVATGAGEYPQPAERIERPRRRARALLVAAPCRRELARLQTSGPGL